MNQNGNNIESRTLESSRWTARKFWVNIQWYSVPVLDLVLLSYADKKFLAATKELEWAGSGRRTIGLADYQAEGVLYLSEASRFSCLVQSPEGGNIGAAIYNAMRAIESNNPDLKDVLPKTYNRFENSQTFGLFWNYEIYQHTIL